MKLFPKVLVTAIVIILAIVAYKFTDDNEPVNSGDGIITLQVVDEYGELIIDDQVSYNEGDNIFELIQRNYDVVCLGVGNTLDDTCSFETQFGYAVLGIDDVKSDWTSSYLQIFVNDIASVNGVTTIQYENNDVIKFVWTDLS